jgi:AraC-like DNA-binding protein
MTTLLDTSLVPREARRDAWISTLREVQGPMGVHIEDPDVVGGTMEAWALGGLQVLKFECTTGTYSTRSEKQAKSAEPFIGIGIQLGGAGRLGQFGMQKTSGVGQLKCIDATAAFESCGWVGPGSCVTMGVTPQQLALPMDVIRRGAAQLHTSHLLPLVSAHVAATSRPSLARNAGAAELGEATIELFRALLVSAAHDSAHEAAVLAETLMTRVRAYIRQHLRDPDLRPAQVAAAHHISLRYLYKLCRESGFSLEQWVIEQRLHGARQQLATSQSSEHGIASIARQWGFSDPAHFSRRFRAAYGMTPREWRLAASSTVPLRASAGLRPASSIAGVGLT